MTTRALWTTAFAVAAIGATAIPAMASEWTGLYLGVQAGGAWGDVETKTLSDTANGFWEVLPGNSFKIDADGVLGGGQIFYNYEFSRWVMGVELTGAGMDFDQTVPLTTDDVYGVDVDWLATATARWGYIVRPTSLLYVKGGYAAGGVKTSEFDNQGAFQGAFKTDETNQGWIAGAGFEQKIAPNFSVGVEYNYVDLGSQDHTGIATTGGVVVNDIDVKMQTVTARLNWQLWAP